MITPSIRQDLQLLPGTPMEDGSPSWLIYDNLRNKYFTLGLNAFSNTETLDCRSRLKTVY